MPYRNQSSINFDNKSLGRLDGVVGGCEALYFGILFSGFTKLDATFLFPDSLGTGFACRYINVATFPVNMCMEPLGVTCMSEQRRLISRLGSGSVPRRHVGGGRRSRGVFL